MQMKGAALELYFEIDGQMHELKRQLRERSGYPHNLRELRNALQSVIDGNFVNANRFPVNVDFRSSVREVIASGNFGWVNRNINDENFPTEGSEKLELQMHLIHFGCRMKSEEVTLALEAQYMRPATLRQLLAFAASYPDNRWESPIVALGSKWQYQPSVVWTVPSLQFKCGKRSLDLDWFDKIWSDNCRFAAVPK
jgi:hypothetical protein